MDPGESFGWRQRQIMSASIERDIPVFTKGDNSIPESIERFVYFDEGAVEEFEHLRRELGKSSAAEGHGNSDLSEMRARFEELKTEINDAYLKAIDFVETFGKLPVPELSEADIAWVQSHKDKWHPGIFETPGQDGNLYIRVNRAGFAALLKIGYSVRQIANNMTAIQAQYLLLGGAREREGGG